MKIKKTLLTITLILFSFVLLACNKKTTSQMENNKESLSITVTIFPIYDWCKNITGTDANLNLLVKNGVDLHSYQPSTKDIMQISLSDIFIYVGGESDTWVKDVLAASKNKNQISINLLEVLKDYVKEESDEGIFQSEEEEETEDSEEEEVEYDEHVWLSIKNSILCCKVIASALEKADSQKAELYQQQTAAYLEKLYKLDSNFEKKITSANKNTIIICDRFPFRYLADDYNLKYFAAFLGCSAETEASFETVLQLSKKADELSPSAIFTIDGSDQKLAKTVLNNSSRKELPVLTLDSMQCITLKEAEQGKNYISIMEENLNTLLKGLE